MASAWDDFIDPTNFQKAWEKVASNRGCAGVDGETISHFAQASDRYLASLQKSLITGQYRPLPLRRILIPKKQGGWRTLGVPTVRDRIVQQAMLTLLHRILDPQFEDNSFAYRPGRSHLMAVDQVRYWPHHGYDWVLDADIVQFFDNVHHQRLLTEVAERMHQPDFLNLIEEWVSIGILTAAGLILPDKGLPQGSVVSPILANTYLDDFDEQCQDQNLKLVRFADDFVILGRSQAQMLDLQKRIQAWLTAIHLQLHPDKTRVASFQQGFRFLGHAFCGDVIVPVQPAIQDPSGSVPNIDHPYRLIHRDLSTSPTTLEHALVEALLQQHRPIPPPLFVALGYAIRPHTSIKISSQEAAWKPDIASLYLVQQGSKLSKEQGRFIIENPKDHRIEIPIREIETILVFGTIHLTPAVISTCLYEWIPVIYLSQLGDYKGHLWSAEHRNIAIELAQFHHLDNKTFRLNISKSILWGKLMNSRQLLLRLNRKRKMPAITETIANLSTDITNLEACTTLDAARGYKGVAAARYFQALGKLFVNLILRTV